MRIEIAIALQLIPKRILNCADFIRDLRNKFVHDLSVGVIRCQANFFCNRISNGKSKGKNNTKNGNKYLSWAYIEAANFMKRYNPRARAFYQKKLAQSNKILALKALAHKISRACFYILKDGVPFDEVKMFCNPKRCDKGCSSEPERGLSRELVAPIGPSAATNLTEQV